MIAFDTASRFFEQAADGFSTTRDGAGYEGVRLHAPGWRLEPAVVERVHSSFYADRDVFPAGSVEIDHALLMRRIQADWAPVGSPAEQIASSR